MKKVMLFGTLLGLLISTAFGLEQSEATPLRFGSAEPVYSIYACYQVQTQGVEDVSVTFSDGVKNYAYANYVDGQLWVSIASATPLNLNQPMGWACAELSDGQTAAPELKLVSLRFNGQDAVNGLIVEAVQGTLNDGMLQVTVSACDDSGASYTMIAAAYRADGKLLRTDISTVDLAQMQGPVFVELEQCAEAACVKALFFNDRWKPIASGVDETRTD